MSDPTDDECVRCHAGVSTRDGDDPTPHCDHCAHKLVEELTETVARLTAERDEAKVDAQNGRSMAAYYVGGRTIACDERDQARKELAHIRAVFAAHLDRASKCSNGGHVTGGIGCEWCAVTVFREVVEVFGTATKEGERS